MKGGGIINRFNYVQYIEGKRIEQGVTQAKLADIIACSASNYANKVSRESFDFKEIANICNFLGINLDSLKISIDVDDSKIAEAIEDLRYAGTNNYCRNERGFEVVENILDNDVILSMLNKSTKFEIGYLMLSVAPNHNGYGIRQAEAFFNRLFRLREKIDADFLVGMLFGAFYQLSQEGTLYLYPKYLYFPKLLEYILDSYNDDSIIYILKELDKKTPLSNSTYIFIPEVCEMMQKCLETNFEGSVTHEKVDSLIKVIRKVIDSKVKNKIIEYELEKFLLKVSYINKIYVDI